MTSLSARSTSSVHRAAGRRRALAERLAPALKRAKRKPVYVDCNAVSPQTAERIGAALDGTGCPYVDAGIIGPPPSATARTIFYASGEGAKTFERLTANGLAIRRMTGRSAPRRR